MKTSKRMTKKQVQKAKRVVSKIKKTQAKRNMDTFYLKARVESTVVPSQGVQVANYVYWRVNLDPTSPTFGMSHLNNAEFQLFSKLYDRYRINSCKVSITPKANMLGADMAQADGEYNLTGSGVVHSVLDRDGAGPSNIAALTRYPSYRKHSALKPFTRTYTVKYPTGIWIDCQSPATFPAAKELGLTGGVTIYGENFLEDNYEVFNEPWAECVVEYGIVFEGKASAGLSFTRGESGEIEGVVVTNQDPARNLDFTEPKPRGTTTDVRIVDEVTDVSITDRGDA